MKIKAIIASNMKMMEHLTQIIQFINAPTAATIHGTAKKNHKCANFGGRKHMEGDSRCWELEENVLKHPAGRTLHKKA